jgi:hypothetical protein
MTRGQRLSERFWYERLAVDAVPPRGEHNAQIVPLVPSAGGQLDAVQPGHLYIGQQCRDTRFRIEEPQRLISRMAGDDVAAQFAKQVGGKVENKGLVINNQYKVRHRAVALRLSASGLFPPSSGQPLSFAAVPGKTRILRRCPCGALASRNKRLPRISRGAATSRAAAASLGRENLSGSEQGAHTPLVQYPFHTLFPADAQ